MAIPPSIRVSGVDVTDHVRKYVEGATLAATAKDSSLIEKGKKLKSDAIVALVDTLGMVFKVDPKIRKTASVALSTTFFVEDLIKAPAALTPTQALGIIAGFFGVIWGIASLVRLFNDKGVNITVGWEGNIKVRVKTQNRRIIIESSVIQHKEYAISGLAKEIFNAIKKATDLANKALDEAVPPEYFDFVWRYLPRPEGDTFFFRLKAIRQAEVDDEDDVRSLTKAVIADINRQLEKVLQVIRGIVQDACMLVFLRAIGAHDRIDYAVENLIPDLGYQVEGLWRKELERLTIKLARTREYDRQIDCAMRAASLHILMESIKRQPVTRLGNAGSFICNRDYIYNKLMNLGKSDPEIRYGFDLIGGSEFKVSIKQHSRGDYRSNIIPGIFYQRVNYILFPKLVGGKIQIGYKRKSLSFNKWNAIYVGSLAIEEWMP